MNDLLMEQRDQQRAFVELKLGNMDLVINELQDRVDRNPFSPKSSHSRRESIVTLKDQVKRDYERITQVERALANVESRNDAKKGAASQDMNEFRQEWRSEMARVIAQIGGRLDNAETELNEKIEKMDERFGM